MRSEEDDELGGFSGTKLPPEPYGGNVSIVAGKIAANCNATLPPAETLDSVRGA